MKTTTLGLVFASVALALGCQYDPNFPSQEELYDVPEAHDVLLVRPADGRFFTVKVGAQDLFGPDVRLSIYNEPADHSVRGSLWGRPVNVRVGNDKAQGAVGVTTFHLAVRREGDALHAVGSVETEPSDFTLTKDRLTGRIGDCEYDVKRTERLTFEGSRGCNGPGQQLTMRIPEELNQWGDVGSATALALLLSQS